MPLVLTKHRVAVPAVDAVLKLKNDAATVCCEGFQVPRPRQIFRILCNGLAGTILCVACASCMMPLPGEVPSTAAASAAGKRVIDPRELTGCSSKKPSRPGMTRQAVHEFLDGLEVTVLDTADGPATRELYRLQNEGAFFYFGPNPEGGLIGVNKRHILYLLEICYSHNGVTNLCEVNQFRDIYDAHEYYWCWPN